MEKGKSLWRDHPERQLWNYGEQMIKEESDKNWEYNKGKWFKNKKSKKVSKKVYTQGNSGGQYLYNCAININTIIDFQPVKEIHSQSTEILTVLIECKHTYACTMLWTCPCKYKLGILQSGEKNYRKWWEWVMPQLRKCGDIRYCLWMTE